MLKLNILNYKTDIEQNFHKIVKTNATKLG